MLLCPTRGTPVCSLLSPAHFLYVCTLSSLSRAADTLISHFQSLCPLLSLSIALSLRPPHLHLFSLSLYLFCLSSSGTLYTPVSLLTSLSVLSPYLSSHRSLQSRQCTVSVTAPHHPPSPLPLPLSVHWTWINSSQCSP